MKAKLKKRVLKNGVESLYIEYYKGYTTDKKGKIKHFRKQENLELYLIQNPKNAGERAKNKSNLELANKILIRKQNQINENQYDFTTDENLKLNFVEYYIQCMEKRKSNKNNYQNWKSCLKHLINYCNPDTTRFKDVNEKFLEGFINYLSNGFFFIFIAAELSLM